MDRVFKLRWHVNRYDRHCDFVSAEVLIFRVAAIHAWHLMQNILKDDGLYHFEINQSVLSLFIWLFIWLISQGC